MEGWRRMNSKKGEKEVAHRVESDGEYFCFLLGVVMSRESLNSHENMYCITVVCCFYLCTERRIFISQSMSLEAK